MNIVYFDLESQKLFHEVGGRDASKLLLACGVTWSTARNDFAVYWEKDAAALVAELKSADRVVGFRQQDVDPGAGKPRPQGAGGRLGQDGIAERVGHPYQDAPWCEAGIVERRRSAMARAHPTIAAPAAGGRASAL